MLSILKAPKGVLKKMNSSKDIMDWQETQEKKRKKHLVILPVLSMPKSCNCPGIMNLDVMNKGC